MAKTFESVTALDVNPILGPSAPNVKKRTGCANELSFETGSVDLLVSLQALHHFNQDPHLARATRVLRPGGVYAALCWGEMRMPQAVKTAYAHVFDAIAPFWEAARAQTLAGYPDLSGLGRPIPLPASYRRHRVTLQQFEEMLAGWSALQAALRAGIDLPEPDITALDKLADGFELRWPLLGKVFRL
jgi:ubiquinone/menaquinone biosynthesis C-methylase UbiE